MRKTATVALFACLASGSALGQSDAGLHGLIDTWAGRVKTAGDSATVVNSGGMSTSYFGFRGGEDLGGGLKTVFALESFVRTDTGEAGRFNGDHYFARDAYVGMHGGFGEARLGRNTTPYFLSTVIFNPFGDSFTFSPMVAHTFLGPAQVQGDTGFDNSIRYITPMWQGLKGDFVWSAGKENSVAPKAAQRAYDVSAFYFRGPVGATVVYQDINLDTIAIGSSQSAWQAGAYYDAKIAKVFGQYQQTRLKADGSADATTHTWQLGAAAPFGPGLLLVSYAHTSNDGNVAVTGTSRKSFALGYEYPLSRRTDLYAAYFDDRTNSPDVRNGAYGAGLRHRF